MLSVSGVQSLTCSVTGFVSVFVCMKDTGTEMLDELARGGFKQWPKTQQ